MAKLAIKADGLSKRYRIGVREHAQDSLIGALGEVVKRPVRNLRRLRGLSRFDSGGSDSGVLWALKDLSFEIRQGDAVGIIGHNGAGKSTLLKILSRITAPTSGRATIQGRVSSLLEVGTGFHPELTGRDNVYLNAAVLGMSRSEIDQKFDAIVGFSGVEGFLDTPLKRYSSGMQVRLAFAVAAHLEPEILIVDEVLAVGDFEFQRKCLGKMEEVAHEGRTVILVSHNLGAIANLCRTCLWIDNGKLRMEGEPRELIREYLKSGTVNLETDPSVWQRKGTAEATVEHVRILDTSGYPCESFSMGETVAVEFDVAFSRPFDFVEMSVDVRKSDVGLNVLHLLTHDAGFVPQQIRPGVMRFRVEVPNCTLYPGSYEISIWIASSGEALDHVENVGRFSMVQSSIAGRTTPFYSHLGVYHPESRWRELDPATEDGVDGALRLSDFSSHRG